MVRIRVIPGPGCSVSALAYDESENEINVMTRDDV